MSKLYDRAKEIGLSHVPEWLPEGARSGYEWTAGEYRIKTDSGAWSGPGAQGENAVELYAVLNRGLCETNAKEHGYRDIEEGVLAEAAREILFRWDPEYFPGIDDDFLPPRKKFDAVVMSPEDIEKLAEIKNRNRATADLTDDEWKETAKKEKGLMYIDDLREKFPQATASLDDIQDAWRLADWLQGNYRWCEIHNSWYVYDCGVWRKDDQELSILRESKLMVLAYEQDAFKRRDMKAYEHFHGIAKNVNRVKRIMESMKPETNIVVELFNRADHLLNCKNGTYNLETGVLQPFVRDEYHTKQVMADYDPDATVPELFTKFIEEIFQGDEELIRYVQKILGYSLSGGTGEQEFYIFWGDGNNGKSQLIKCFSRLVDSYAHNMGADKIMLNKWQNNDTYIAQLKKIRALFCSESSQSKTLDSDLIKTLTGGEPVTVAQKYEKPETFEISAKVFLITNNKPTIRDTTEGIWRRIRLIPFEYVVPVSKRIKDFGDVLYKSGPSGILNWLIEGYQLYRIDGLEAPDVVRTCDSEYRSEEDVLLQFLSEKCLRIGDSRLTLEEVYQSFVEFSRDMTMRWSKKRLSKELKSKHFVIDHGRNGRVVTGLAWRDPRPGDLPLEEDDAEEAMRKGGLIE